MSNMRIVYRNIADTATALTASNTSGSLVASNLLTDLKTQVHRSTTTAVTYTLTWNSAQKVGCVAIPCTNVTSTATVSVRLYSDEQATQLVYSSGTVTAVPGYNLDPKQWPQGLNANTFAYGGSTKITVWIPNQPSNIRAVLVDISDSSNPVGYIDSARLVVGEYWSPQFNIQNGADFQFVDNSEITRRDSGDLVTNRKFVHDTFSFNFSLLPEVDKSRLLQIIRSIGTYKNIFVSLLPEDASAKTAQDSSIYGKRSNSSIQYQLYSFYAHSMEITGW